MIPPYCKKIFDTPIFPKHWSDAHKSFRHCETKIFDGETWYPLVCIEFFNIPIVLKHWKDAHKSFRHCETKNFRRKIVIPHKCIKFFDTPNFLEDWRDALEVFRHCETKTFRRENVIPPSMHRVFHYPNFTWNIERMPTKFFGTVRPKSLEAKTWYALFHPEKFLKPEILSKTVRFPHEIFRHCETKIFRPKIVKPPIMHEIFRYLKFSEILKGCPQIFSALWDKNISTENFDTPYYA